MRESLFYGLAIGLALTGCNRPAMVAKACTPPRNYWQQPHYIGGLIAPYIQVTLDHRNQLYMSGKPVTPEQFSSELDKIYGVTNPDAQILLDTEMGADCSTLEAARDEIDRALKCKTSGRCAEGSRSVWKEWPLPPNAAPS